MRFGYKIFFFLNTPLHISKKCFFDVSFSEFLLVISAVNINPPSNKRCISKFGATWKTDHNQRVTKSKCIWSKYKKKEAMKITGKSGKSKDGSYILL